MNHKDTALHLKSLVGMQQAQAYAVDIESSTIQWQGSKVIGNSHTGKIKIKEGTFLLEHTGAVAADVVVDMQTIVNEDLTSPEWNRKLVDHLNSPDFFDVTKHPSARLVITSSASHGASSRLLKGDLTIKGITHPVSFTGTVRDEGGQKILKANLSFDRSAYDVRFGSGRFFSNLGDNLIADEVKLSVEVHLRPL